MAHREPESAEAPCLYADTAGAFVLCALSRDGRDDFVAHLDTCPRCDSDVEELLPVVRLLDTARPC
ncbi:MAG: hypothetical protein JWQ81_7345 [Amycolatopsis sp.]|uniref:hypothetical protein n=1 Tax=Amycolatopsis sp. TaxID=37632 RepID=UPI0026259190|nr:hypothetical protein [Amycolatopsis sp.]MCU1686606.1 hypothetical protein [Amycolatopsis sp.]